MGIIIRVRLMRSRGCRLTAAITDALGCSLVLFVRPRVHLMHLHTSPTERFSTGGWWKNLIRRRYFCMCVFFQLVLYNEIE